MLYVVVLVSGYVALCWFCLRQPRDLSGSPGELLVAYASQSGRAEALARAQARAMTGPEPVPVLPLDRVSGDVLARARQALFVVSTYGEGEPPDNGLGFARRWLNGSPRQDLSHLSFAVLALGDSGYRRFCGFGLALERGLRGHGALPLFPAVTLDMATPAPDLSAWQRQLRSHGLVAPAEGQDGPLRTEHSFAPWRLTGRVCLNPGSPGAPVFHLQLTAPAGPERCWQAGDIAVIRPGNDPGQPLREYSIASVMDDGTLDLLVRQVRKDDGRPGLGSGWLLDGVRAGGAVELAIRRNPAFHGPDPSRPMILIGNGTGMAGLRAHLRERARGAPGGHPRNWLLFGERRADCDRHFGTEVDVWLANGHLARPDYAFSRDQPERRYVQHLLRDAYARLGAWLERGAVIYVCGSADGMAGAVHRVLQDQLGEARLEALLAEGRYRRDIY